MSKRTANRPTERLATRNTKERPLAALSRLQELLAYAVRCHDQAGAHLLRHAVARVLAGGRIGAV